MATQTIIVIDLKTDNFLQTINTAYEELLQQGATTIELQVNYDDDPPAGYEINLISNLSNFIDSGICPKPCNKCHK
jgi:hypothetical protein